VNYDDLTKEALVEILKRRDAQAHYGLQWERHSIERDKALNHDFVGFELDLDLSIGLSPWDMCGKCLELDRRID
jgi:adenine-specific DNA-methyltransferase